MFHVALHMRKDIRPALSARAKHPWRDPWRDWTHRFDRLGTEALGSVPLPNGSSGPGTHFCDTTFQMSYKMGTTKQTKTVNKMTIRGAELAPPPPPPAGSCSKQLQVGHATQATSEKWKQKTRCVTYLCFLAKCQTLCVLPVRINACKPWHAGQTFCHDATLTWKKVLTTSRANSQSGTEWPARKLSPTISAATPT